MPATEIYLIRHGQTDYNRQFRLQGRSDIPLNRLGLAQARAAHEALRGVHFDAVYASPLRRAVDTACIVSGWPEEKNRAGPTPDRDWFRHLGRQRFPHAWPCRYGLF